MTDLSLLLLFCAAAFLAGGFVKGVIGMGLPTIAIGLMSLAVAPAQAAAVLIIPSLVTNIVQLLQGDALKRLVKRLATMMAGVCIGTWAGAGWMTGTGSPIAGIVLGTALIVYAIVGLGKISFHVTPRWEPLLSPLVGIATGLISAATGVFVIPAVPYLQALGLQKDEMVQALGFFFTVSTLALAVNLLRADLLSPDIAVLSLVALAAALGGQFLGRLLRGRLDPDSFRLWFFLSLLALGAYLVIQRSLAL
ncbi:MAG: sulfite exporter TauE/SafE family protein [Alphaproteobacteria bacterium]|nr:sulfite exporter TauE/SafE family protein [Alphaproteobacteria bacterium]MBU0798130.1 sulfite exporter TauE/SafE family protein [Alphaproteobacteria bacterium]MBU0887053.1 sulfite exporter TauE/SafE family protein [Alphaproteobacteria bacterium]MBU1814303.1 sulfite exporter TauE/SafE family protein [Alphaproteobacteria bacterium]